MAKEDQTHLAFEDIVGQHSDFVYSLTYRILNNHADIEPVSLLEGPEKMALNRELREHLEAGLADYFWFYNHERPHQALGYQTPAEVYFGNLGAEIASVRARAVVSV